MKHFKEYDFGCKLENKLGNSYVKSTAFQKLDMRLLEKKENVMFVTLKGEE